MGGILAVLLAMLVAAIACREGRARSLLVPVLVGAAVGAILYPVGFGLVMGYGQALGEPRASHFWGTFRVLVGFWTLGPIVDTAPRGALMGMLLGLCVGLRREAARSTRLAEALMP